MNKPIDYYFDEDFFKIQDFIGKLNENLVVLSADNIEEDNDMVEQLVYQVKIYGTKIMELYDVLDQIYNTDRVQSGNSEILLSAGRDSLVKKLLESEKLISEINEDRERLHSQLEAYSKQVDNLRRQLDMATQYPHLSSTNHGAGAPGCSTKKTSSGNTVTSPPVSKFLSIMSDSRINNDLFFSPRNEIFSDIKEAVHELEECFSERGDFVKGCEIIQKLDYNIDNYDLEKLNRFLFFSNKIKDNYIEQLFLKCFPKRSQDNLPLYFNVVNEIDNMIEEMRLKEKQTYLEYDGKIEYLNAQIQDFSNKMDAKDKELHFLRKSEETGLSRRLEMEKAELNKMLEITKGDFVCLKEEKLKLERDVGDLLNEFSDLKEKYQALVEENEEKCALIEKFQEEREFSEKLEDFERLKEELNDKESRLESLSRDMERKNSELEIIKAELKRLQSKLNVDIIGSDKTLEQMTTLITQLLLLPEELNATLAEGESASYSLLMRTHSNKEKLTKLDLRGPIQSTTDIKEFLQDLYQALILLSRELRLVVDTLTKNIKNNHELATASTLSTNMGKESFGRTTASNSKKYSATSQSEEILNLKKIITTLKTSVSQNEKVFADTMGEAMKKLKEMAKKLISMLGNQAGNVLEKPQIELEETIGTVQKIYSHLESCIDLFPDANRIIGKNNYSDSILKGSPRLDSSSLGDSTGMGERRFNEEGHTNNGGFSDPFMRTETMSSPSILSSQGAERRVLKDKLETYRQEITANLNVSLRNLHRQKQDDMLLKLNEEIEKNKANARKIEKLSLMLSKQKIASRDKDSRLEAILENFKAILASEGAKKDSTEQSVSSAVLSFFTLIKREVLEDKLSMENLNREVASEIAEHEGSILEQAREDYEKQKNMLKSSYSSIIEELKKSLQRVTEERDKYKKSNGERENSLRNEYMENERIIKDKEKIIENLKRERTDLEEQLQTLEKKLQEKERLLNEKNTKLQQTNSSLREWEEKFMKFERENKQRKDLFEHQEDSAQREIEYLRRQSEEYFVEVTSLKERLQDIEGSVEDMEKIIFDKEKNLSNIQAALRDLNEAKNIEEEARKRLETELGESRTLWKAEIEGKENDINKIKDDSERLVKKFEDYRERMAIVESEYKNIIDLKSLNEKRLEEQANSLRENFDLYKRQQEQFKSRSEEQVDLVNQKFREVQKGYASKIEQLNGQIERLQESFEQQIDLKNTEIDQLKMNLEHYENFSRSQREAINLREEQICAANKRIGELEQEMKSRESQNSEIFEMRKKLKNYNETFNVSANELTGLKRDLDSMIQNQKELELKLVLSEKEKEDFKMSVNALSSSREILEKKNTALIHEIESVRGELQEIHAKLKRSSRVEADLQEKLKAAMKKENEIEAIRLEYQKILDKYERSFDENKTGIKEKLTLEVELYKTQMKQREEVFSKETEYFKREIENANIKISEMQKIINEKFDDSKMKASPLKNSDKYSTNKQSPLGSSYYTSLIESKELEIKRLSSIIKTLSNRGMKDLLSTKGKK